MTIRWLQPIRCQYVLDAVARRPVRLPVQGGAAADDGDCRHTDPSVWFTDLGACYRIVDRSGISVQRLKERYKEA
jgi:hypothetical protein